MRAAVNVVLAWSAIAAIQAAAPLAAAAEREAQAGESRWVPSLALTSGITMQRQTGAQSSFHADGTPLRAPKVDEDRVIAPFVGAALELMAPALPLRSGPRAFVSGEILPTFASERLLALDGEPSRIRGPDVGSVLAVEEDEFHYTTEDRFGPGPRQIPFGENDANGQGMRTNAQLDKLVFGAKLGVSFGFEWRGRQMRVKPSAGWIHYEIETKGYLVDPTCRSGGTVCTNTYFPPASPGGPGTVNFHGFLRESILSGSESSSFDGIGPGIDLEMDTGRIGPLGTALFVGVHGYYILSDREISFSASRSFNDELGSDTHTAHWRTRVAPWMYRAGIGFRFQWLGSPQ